MSSSKNFKSGDKVVRKVAGGFNYTTLKFKYTYGGPFTVHLAENGYVFDLYLNKFPEYECVHESEYNTPLWKAFSED